jgi:carboxyl-terminal processing protease
MKITTASYWRPSGKNIHRAKDAGPKSDWGVLPDKDCIVEMTDDEQNDWRQWRAHRDGFQPSGKNGAVKNGVKPFVDHPLVRAVEYLEKETNTK